MSASIRIGKVFGVPINLHITFLLVLPLFAYIFSDPPSQTEVLGIALSLKNLDAATWVKYAFGSLAAIVFFATILVHELVHSYIALRYGIKIKGITLMVFGGVSSMEEMPRQPGQEWRMAFAGPLSSLVIGGASYGAMLVLKLAKPGDIALDGTIILLGLIAFYNVLLAGFNMIPAFPMDGGRVLRAFFASRMPYIEATKKAARIARYFAISMGIFGIFYNFFFILIAMFVYIAATEEEHATIISESLHGLTVRQVMSDKVAVVHPDTSVLQLHDLMLSTKYMGFPVVEGGLIGIVTLSDTHKVPRDKIAFARVRDIMTRNVVTIPPEMEAAKALYLLSERRIGRLVVMDGSRIAGIVTQKDFLRAIDVVSAKRQVSRWGQQFPPEEPPMAPV